MNFLTPLSFHTCGGLGRLVLLSRVTKPHNHEDHLRGDTLLGSALLSIQGSRSHNHALGLENLRAMKSEAPLSIHQARLGTCKLTEYALPLLLEHRERRYVIASVWFACTSRLGFRWRLSRGDIRPVFVSRSRAMRPHKFGWNWTCIKCPL